jgi:hypothetical protein
MKHQTEDELDLASYEALSAAIDASAPNELEDLLLRIAEARKAGVMEFDSSLLFQASRRHAIPVAALSVRYDAALARTGVEP